MKLLSTCTNSKVREWWWMIHGFDLTLGSHYFIKMKLFSVTNVLCPVMEVQPYIWLHCWYLQNTVRYLISEWSWSNHLDSKKAHLGTFDLRNFTAQTSSSYSIAVDNHPSMLVSHLELNQISQAELVSPTTFYSYHTNSAYHQTYSSST